MIKYAKTVLYNTDLDTTQAFVFSEANHYLALLIAGSGEDVFTKIRQAVLDLQEEFFEMESDIPERFERFHRDLESKLTDLEGLELVLASWRVSSEEGASVKGATDILYLQGWGGGRVYLKRQEEVVPLITEDLNGQLISGYLDQGDRILILDKTLDKILSGDLSRLGYALSLPVTDLEEGIQSFLPRQGIMNPLAAILIDYKLRDDKIAADLTEDTLPSVPLTSGTLSRAKSIRKLIRPNFAGLGAIKTKVLSRVSFARPNRLPSPQYLSSSINSKPKLLRIFYHKKRLGALAAVVIIVVLFLVVVLRSHKVAQVKAAQIQALLSAAQNDFSTAQDLKNLNTDSATKSLNQAQNEVAQALQLDPKNSQALDLKQKIATGKNDILKIYPIDNWPLFLDLKLIKSDFSAEQMSYASGRFLLLDPIQKTLVSVDADQKTNQILGGSLQLGDAQKVALSDALVTVYSPDKGILTEDVTNPIKPNVMIKPDSSWGKIADLSSFGGNIYLLDSGQNSIWKYVATTNGYADKISYLKAGVNTNLSDAKKMLIDSSIWVLKTSGEIDKFTSGAPDFFSPANLDTPLKSVESFYVSPDTDNIYLLDVGNGRLVVLKKNGQYASQYTGDKFKDAADVAVDEKSKKIYLLENNKIYQIDLQ